MPQRVIQIHAAGPRKPSPGEPCNGCGICCSAEPCPLGQWLSRRRHGACEALSWNAETARHECDVLVRPRHWLRWLPEAAGRRLASRWIASGTGCDCDYEVQPAG